MKFVHIADMHFDTPFIDLTVKADLGDKRRLEQREIFKKAIEYIKENNIKYLFISGDLYEEKYVKESTINFINGLFGEIPNTQIFISPGNHDPFIKNSYYEKYNWNKNVIIFSSEIKKIELEDCNIYGFGYTDFYCENCGIENVQIENSSKNNILVIHASLDASDTLEKQYNPINSKYSKQFDYVALGHIHKPSYNTKLVYPGSMISFGFDEIGEHGMLVVDLEKEERKIEFIKLDNRIFIEQELDITELNSEEEIIETINNLQLKENYMYKIILVGMKKFEINTKKIFKLIYNENILKIKDKTEYGYDIEELSKQNNLKGIFVKNILLQKENYTEEQIKQAIEIGLNLLN